MTAIIVKPCPFCAYEDGEIDEVDIGTFAVICPECQCNGPTSDESTEAAIDAWNKALRHGGEAE